MFTYVESRSEVHYCQQTLEKTIRESFKEGQKRDIGFPGGHALGETIRTNRKYWYHTSDFSGPDIPNARRLNWFGLYTDDRRYYLNISVEINTSFQDRNDRIAGFFGKDVASGVVYLFHSGRVGGGTKGVGKDAFLAWSNRRPEIIIDSKGNTRFGVLVMPIEGAGATQSLMHYIDTIIKFKESVRAGSLETTEYKQNIMALGEFYEESRGRRKGRRSSIVDYLSRHGEIVDALYGWRSKLKLARDEMIVKNVLIDLGVKKNSDLVEVFEVKTSAGRQDVYTAIGQLMVHGTGENCRRVVVLPADGQLAPDLTLALERLGIEIVTFKLSETQVVIK